MKAPARILAVLAALSLLFSACGTTDTSWVYEQDGTTLPAGLYISYQMQALDEAEALLAQAHTGDSTFQLPEKLSEVAKLPLEGTTVEDWVNQQARERTKSYFVLQREAARLGVSISDADAAALQNSVDSLWSSYGATLEKAGIAKSSYSMYQQNEMLSALIFEKMYGAGGEREVPVEELKALFAGKYAKAEVLLVSKLLTAAEGESLEEKNAQRKTMAEGFLERLRQGESIEAVEYDYRLATAADETAKAAVTQKAEGALANIFQLEEAGYYQPGLVDALKAAKPGEPTLAEGESHFFLIVRRDILADEADLATYRPALLAGEKLDEFDAWLVGESGSITPVENQPALSRYKMGKLQELRAQ